MTSILVVEDEQVVALDIEYTLRSLGYAVPAIAGTAAEALRYAEMSHPDVALMDIRLRGEMDGVEAAGLLRDRFDLPVIYLTAYSDEHTLMRARASDPYGYLMKPFNQRALHTAIEIALHKHSMELRLKRLEAGQRFLAKASKELSTSLDPRVIIERLAQSVVGSLGDGCAVQLVTGESAFAHVEPALLSRFETTCRAIVAENTARGGGFHSDASLLIADVPVDGPDPGDLSLGVHGLGRIARSVLCVPIITLAGSVIGRLTVARSTWREPLDARDVSLAEDVAQRAGVSLEHARLYAAAEEARRARDIFIAMAAHELKGPVTVLKLQMDLATRAASNVCADTSQDAVRTTLEKLGRSVSRLGLLLANVLNVSALSAGHMDLRFVTVDLDAVTRDIVEQMRLEAERSGSSITVTCSGRPLGQWDPLRIEQIVSNLLSNAIKYGGGKPIAVSIDERDGIASLAVSDHGIGIAAELQAKIFEPFERAVGDRAFAGIGMGLWIVRQIVAALGGSTELSSTLGEGATFTIRLPTTRPIA